VETCLYEILFTRVSQIDIIKSLKTIKVAENLLLEIINFLEQSNKNSKINIFFNVTELIKKKLYLAELHELLTYDKMSVRDIFEKIGYIYSLEKVNFFLIRYHYIEIEDFQISKCWEILF